MSQVTIPCAVTAADFSAGWTTTDLKTVAAGNAQSAASYRRQAAETTDAQWAETCIARAVYWETVVTAIRAELTRRGA